ncbi:hypothetical protein [Halohasta salina]|uniref:hypothetical protein n=1 Tax=Halohasta salina TaxID=2961621 RepID=UPI0020A4B592|nr:hypothetical protein [Halohasta salina]
MLTRRTLLSTLGGSVALASCLSGDSDPAAAVEPTEPDRPNDRTVAADRTETVDRTDPESTAWRFYETLLGGDVDALNGLVHPESPGYPVAATDLPPERFTQFETVRIADTEAVSVQDRVVQRLYPNVTRTSRTRKAMGAERMQYVHTRFYITRPDDEGIYEADTIDYLVRDDGQWYVRYEGASDR